MGYQEAKRRAWAFVDRFGQNRGFGAAEALLGRRRRAREELPA